jgi:hypothetical protein
MTEQQQRDLAAGLRALSDSTRETNASPHVEAAVLAAMDRVPNTEHRAPAAVRLLPLAAALILAVGGALWTARTVPPPRIASPAGFVALPEAGALPQMESATIVRVSLPVAALPGYGIAIVDLKSDSIVAELLVAQDGRPRAIRFVNDSD